MQLTIHEVAKLLNVPERVIYRWVDDKEIPVSKVGEDIRFNRTELLEWATLKKLPISSDVLADSGNKYYLVNALGEGGLHKITATNRSEALKAMISVLRLPSENYRRTILEIIMARGEHALTPVGDGIAIPHVRQPVTGISSSPIVALFFLEKPIDLDAPDHKPVSAFFFMLSPTVKTHLLLLSRLANVLHDDKLKDILHRQGSLQEILQEIYRIEGAEDTK